MFSAENHFDQKVRRPYRRRQNQLGGGRASASTFTPLLAALRPHRATGLQNIRKNFVFHNFHLLFRNFLPEKSHGFKILLNKVSTKLKHVIGNVRDTCERPRALRQRMWAYLSYWVSEFRTDVSKVKIKKK